MIERKKLEELLTYEGKPILYILKCRIVAYVDADTIEVRWLAERAGMNWRIRLKDEWKIEDEKDPEEHARVLAEMKATLGDVGGLVWIRNTQHYRIFERIEARVDPA